MHSSSQPLSRSSSFSVSMSSSKDHMDSHPTFDQHEWITRIREALAQEQNGTDGGDAETPVSIFGVSKSLLASKPEAYIPHQVAIGPYHQWRSELYEMERYKFMAARIIQEHLQGISFEGIVDQFMKLDYKIRTCYDRYVDVSNETLAWMMAVDGSFLLEFLQIYGGDQTADDISRVSSRMSQVIIDQTGKSATYNAILRDIIMLENQIPLFLLRELLSYCKHENPNEALAMRLIALCRCLSPFKRIGDSPPSENEILKMGHLLELLYHLCVPKNEEIHNLNEAMAIEKPGRLQRVSRWVTKLLCAPLSQRLKNVLTSRQLKSVMKLPFRMVGKMISSILSSSKNAANEVTYLEKKIAAVDHDIESAFHANSTKPHPLTEELLIPSVVELSHAGIRFSATKGNIWSIRFDNLKGIIYLPRITVDENTEVVLRNLVAFESTSPSKPQIFTRYTELMNGIIDTQEDVKLLREKGIVVSHLRSDQEVADRWNEMTRSLFLTKVAHLDKVIEDVNRYYWSRWKVRFWMVLKKYVYASWPFLTLIAANLFLLLTALQTFCSVYSCGSVVHVKNIPGMTNSTML